MFRVASTRIPTVVTHRSIPKSLIRTTTTSRSFSSLAQPSSSHKHQSSSSSSSSSSSFSSSSSSSSHLFYLSSLAAITTATGVILYNSSHEPIQAAPLTHNHPHNPIVLATTQELPKEVIGSDLIIAPRWRRALAAITDHMIQGAIGTIGQYLFPGNFIVLVISISYEILLNVYNDGQTLGKMLTRVRTVKDSGESVDLQAAFLNWFGHVFFTLLVGSDILWSAFNISGDYKCLHNVISSTIVVDTYSLAAETKQDALIRWSRERAQMLDEEEDD